MVSAPARRQQVKYAQGRAGARGDARAVGPVPAVWLSAHQCVPGAGGSSDGLGSHAPVVEAGRLAGTAQTATPPRRQPTPAAITGDGPEPDVAYAT